jgi:hypothetical protein
VKRESLSYLVVGQFIHHTQLESLAFVFGQLIECSCERGTG